MGTPLREILEEHAGGMQDGVRFRGVLPGGASTDFLVDDHLDVPMDYESVQKAGSRLGTGTMIVLDDRTCPVGMVRNLEQFFAQESCGWCTPCWAGLRWAERILGPWRTGRDSRATWSACSFRRELLARAYLLRPRARRRRAAAERAEVLPRRFRAAHPREALPVEMTWRRSSSSNRTRRADGQNLLHACLSLGLNLPYFCWHPAMGSVGACRQCAVKQFRDEKDTHGKLVMACMTAAAPARASRSTTRSREFRASVAEWLMVNHPHDCPVCDEGGECHLQDMTVMTGHDATGAIAGQADVPQPGPGPVREPRDEPLHPVLPLRALLSRLRRRPRLRRLLPA